MSKVTPEEITALLEGAEIKRTSPFVGEMVASVRMKGGFPFTVSGANEAECRIKIIDKARELENYHRSRIEEKSVVTEGHFSGSDSEEPI